MASGMSGSDDSFIAFCFAIFTLLMICMYFPVFLGIVAESLQYLRGDHKKKRRNEDDDVPKEKPSWRILADDFTEVPRYALKGLRNVTHVSAGASILKNHRQFARTVFMGDAIRTVFRPRFIVLCIWIALTSSAMYTSLTYDPYAVLGLPTSATQSQIKKRVRELTVLNHPDTNKTEIAKPIYAAVRKANKALTNREAFEKDADHEEMTFGVALPTFLTSPEHKGKVLLGLLAVLIGVPLLIWYKFQGNSITALQDHMRRIRLIEEGLEPLYAEVGVPVDPRFVDRRAERQELARALVACGVLPSAEESAVEHFPPLADFKRMCQEPERNAQNLQRVGFPPQLFPMLKEFFASYVPQERPKLPEGQFVRVDRVSQETLVYIIDQAQRQVELECETLMTRLARMLGLPGVELKVITRLAKHHKDTLSALGSVYKEQKPHPHDVKFLTEVPAKRQEMLRDIPRQIQELINAHQQEAARFAQQAQQAQERRR